MKVGPVLTPGVKISDEFELLTRPRVKRVRDLKTSRPNVRIWCSRRLKPTASWSVGTSRSRASVSGLGPLSLADAKRLVEQYVAVYNEERLHSGIGYVTPQDWMAGRQAEIHAARDRKLEQARRQRELEARSELPGRSKSILSSLDAAA